VKRVNDLAPVGAATIVMAWSAAVCMLLAAGCTSSKHDDRTPAVKTLRIGFGLATGTTPEIGIQQAARNLALEGLVSVGRDGHTTASLAESWTPAANRLAWNIHLRQSVTFHDGTPVDADMIRRILEPQLPKVLGPARDDVAEIHVRSDHDLELMLRRASTFPMERLDAAVIQKPEAEPDPASPGNKPIAIGTGPFAIVRQEGTEIEMRANDNYYGGRPLIDRVIIRPYPSVRAAWADLLRGQVDMVYDVGVDALDSLEASSDIRTFTFQRAYAFLVLLNTRKPYLADPSIRRALNQAIDREALVRDAFRGHATPAEGPVWPRHWAHSADLPRFGFQPKPLPPHGRLRLKCLFVDQSHERLALMIQQQLRPIGVDLDVESVASAEEVTARLEKGDFDAFLADFLQGPNLARPYLYWHSGGPNNYGRYSNKQVDAALDSIRHSSDDNSYRAGVAAFQRAMVDDPPAVFIAWRERARAVSTRFAVPEDPDTDVLRSIHRWQPVAAATPLGQH
jgi:peptide/nickel transport system substrate-binding protein